MPVVVRSRRGVNQALAAEVVVEARAIAARYPSDPAVLAALALLNRRGAAKGSAISSKASLKTRKVARPNRLLPNLPGTSSGSAHFLQVRSASTPVS